VGFERGEIGGKGGNDYGGATTRPDPRRKFRGSKTGAQSRAEEKRRRKLGEKEHGKRGNIAPVRWQKRQRYWKGDQQGDEEEATGGESKHSGGKKKGQTTTQGGLRQIYQQTAEDMRK